MVELPSKPHLGISASEGGFSNCLTSVLPRSSGTGSLPSSQIYSSLYFVIGFGWNHCESCHSDARRGLYVSPWHTDLRPENKEAVSLAVRCSLISTSLVKLRVEL